MPSNRRRTGGCWPDAGQQALLRAALLDGPEARSAWEAWAATVDVETIDEGSFRLLPLLYANLERLGVQSPLLPRLKGVHRQSWYKNQILFKWTAELLALMNEAGIETLLLKGVPLAHLHYDNEATRPMSDVDVLVRPHDVAAATDLLRKSGWRPKYDLRTLPTRYRRAWPFWNGDRSIDLHWRAFDLGPTPDDALWNESVALTIRGAGTRTLSAPAHVLHAVVHGLVWSAIPPIRWIADATMVLRRAGSAFDWDQFFRESERRKALPAIAAAFQRIPLDLTTLMPPEVIARVGAAHTTRSDRFAIWARTEPGVVPAACRVWLNYQQYLEEPGEASHSGFLKYLRGIWLLDRDDDLTRAIAARIKRRLHDVAPRAS